VPKLEYPDFKPSDPPAGWRGEAPGGRREGGLTLATGPEAPAQAPPKTNRYEATLKPEMPPADPAKIDESKFPGGIVPTKLPPKRLIRGYKTGR